MITASITRSENGVRMTTYLTTTDDAAALVAESLSIPISEDGHGARYDRTGVTHTYRCRYIRPTHLSTPEA